MKTKTTGKALLSTLDVCYLYRVVPMTVWDWRKNKGLPFLRVNSGKFSKKAPIRFNLETVLAWCARRMNRRPEKERLAQYLK